MSSSGEQPLPKFPEIPEIAAEPACPQCQYNLRGLRGDIVTCPECGTVCDVAKLSAAQALDPPPGMNRITVPAAIMLAGFFVAELSLLAASDQSRFPGRSVAAGVALITIAAWLWSVQRAVRWFDYPGGLGLVLLVHVLVAGYAAAAVVCVFLFFMALFGEPFVGSAGLGGVVGMLGIAAAIAGAILCFRGQKYVARQCLSRHISRAGQAH